LDRNQKQNRVEKRILERSAMYPQENIQSRKSLGEGLYRGRGGQIV